MEIWKLEGEVCDTGKVEELDGVDGRSGWEEILYHQVS